MYLRYGLLSVSKGSAEPNSLVGSDADFEKEVAGSISGSAILFPRIGVSHCDRIHSSFMAVRCFHNGYVGGLERVLRGVLVK